MKKETRATLLFIALGLTAACSVGPKYQKPAVRLPGEFRGSSPGGASQVVWSSLGDLQWPEVFRDQQLQSLIQSAIEHNYDVRIAAARILQAEAQLGITRADQFPTVAGITEASNVRIAASRFPAFNTSLTGMNLAVSWQADFWGEFRRASDAARAELLAADWAQRAVVSTLVADLAGSYFRLRELDMELEISRRTLASREESLRLNQSLADRGLVSMLDVRQAEQLVFTAAATIADLERRVVQEENLISYLSGNNPAAIPRGLTLREQYQPPEVAAGLPSSLLERRPDIQQAEQRLVAFNARIGVARAAYFPRIALTADGGFQSPALGSLFSGPAGLWSLVGGLTQPIFEGGRIRSGVHLAEAQQQEAVLSYQPTIQRALREVSDALVGYRKNREFREQQEQLSRSAQDAAELADIRYRAGVTSYLEVLTNQTNYFAAELGLAQARLAELLSLVQLYRALGGGW